MTFESPTPSSKEALPSILARETVEAGESGIMALLDGVPAEMRKDVADALVDFMHELGGYGTPGRPAVKSAERTQALIEKLKNFKP